MTQDSTSTGRGRRRSILFVHGHDFKPDRDALLELCLSAMRAGIERDYPDCLPTFDSLHCDIAYYGDLNNEILRGLGRHYDADLDVGDRHNALRQLREIPARKRFGIRQYDRLPGKTAVPEFIADFFYPVLRLFGLAMPIIRRMSRDFHAYLRGQENYAAEVRERVQTKLCEMLDRGDEVLLLTHGTGSIIAYDVLWSLCHDQDLQHRYGNKKVNLWVTLGAPLGDSQIRKRLKGAGKKSAATYPTNIISWYNVAAEDDYTCHDNTVADDFKNMLSQRMVSAIQDFHVFNHAVRYGKSNPHSSIGYYIHPRVSKIVADWTNPP